MFTPKRRRDGAATGAAEGCLADSGMNAKTAMALFDQDRIRPARRGRPVETNAPLGVLTEPYLARRYAEKADAAARSALGI